MLSLNSDRSKGEVTARGCGDADELDAGVPILFQLRAQHEDVEELRQQADPPNLPPSLH